jgi:hypothetical protein
LLAVVALSLPLGIAQSFGMPPERGVTLWLVGLCFASIGPPFIALAASAPLLQSWFTATGHKQAANPYVLYAASNLGSFAALLAYPFLIEPMSSLQTQLMLWSTGFCALAVLIALAAFQVAGREIDAVGQEAEAGPRPSRQCLSWTVLAAVPSALVIAVTAYISTDLAAAPFLWVVPLALYLLTFVAVFRERPWIAHATTLRIIPYGVAPLAISAFNSDKVFWVAIIALNLLIFVLIALGCHGEAYRTRPHRGRLTEFYLWISFGGMVGGVCAGLIAPNVFNNTYEYPILLAAALLVLPGMFKGGWQLFLRDAGPWLFVTSAIMLIGTAIDIRALLADVLPVQAFAILLVALVAVMLFNTRCLARFFGLMVLALTVTRLWTPGVTPILTARSFFGVHQVVETTDRSHYLLFHGTTIHGAAHVRDESGQPVLGRPEPLTYYYFGGPISDAVEATRRARGTLGGVAVVGLGAGSLACHRRDGEQWTFFEIDPEVARIARDPALFRFLSVCAPSAPIVLGDARLTLAATPGRYDLIVLDAFSSDAIPIHLLTREAFAGYLSHLAPHGVIAVHVSNRHMELANVVAAVGAAQGLVAYLKQDGAANDFSHDYHANARVVVLAKDTSDLGDLPSRNGWERIVNPGVAVWTDDYSNVIGAIIRQKFGG